MDTYTIEAIIRKDNLNIEVVKLTDTNPIQLLYDAEAMVFLKIKTICKSSKFVSKKEEKYSSSSDYPRSFHLSFTDGFLGVLKVYKSEVGYFVDAYANILFEASSFDPWTSFSGMKLNVCNSPSVFKSTSKLPKWEGNLNYGQQTFNTNTNK